jgi:hypothetical protein
MRSQHSLPPRPLSQHARSPQTTTTATAAVNNNNNNNKKNTRAATQAPPPRNKKMAPKVDMRVSMENAKQQTSKTSTVAIMNLEKALAASNSRLLLLRKCAIEALRKHPASEGGGEGDGNEGGGEGDDTTPPLLGQGRYARVAVLSFASSQAVGKRLHGNTWAPRQSLTLANVEQASPASVFDLSSHEGRARAAVALRALCVPYAAAHKLGACARLIAWYDARQTCALRLDDAGATLWGPKWSAGSGAKEVWAERKREQARAAATAAAAAAAAGDGGAAGAARRAH